MAEKRKPREAFGIASKPLLGGVFKQPVSSLVQSRYDNAYPGVSDAYLPYIDPYATLSRAQEYRQFDQQLMAQDQEQRALGAIEKLWQDPSANRSTGLRQIIGENPLASSSPMLQAYLEADKLTSRTGAGASDPYIRSIKDPQARTEYQRALQQGLSPDDAYTQALVSEEDRAVSTSIADKGLDPNKYMRNGKIDRTAAKKDLEEAERLRPTKPFNERIKSASVIKRVEDGLTDLNEAIDEQSSPYGPYQERLTRFDDESYLSGLDPAVKKELSSNPPFDGQGNLTPYWSEKIEKDRAAKVDTRLKPRLNSLVRSGMALGEIADETGLPIEEIQSILNPKSATKDVQNPIQTTERPLSEQVPATVTPPVSSLTAPQAAPFVAPANAIVSLTDARNAQRQAVEEEQKTTDTQEAKDAWQTAKIEVLSGLQRLIGGNGTPPAPGYEGVTMPMLLKEIADGRGGQIAVDLGIADQGQEGYPQYKPAETITRGKGGRNAVSWETVLNSLVGSGNASSRDLLARYGISPENLTNPNLPANYPRPKSAAEVKELKPGTIWMAPNGQLKTR